MQKILDIVVAKNAGFCFGVKRAVDMAFKAAQSERGVYTLGPVIHNPQVVQKLIEKNVFPTDDINDKNISTLLIRTHGIPIELSKKLSKKKYKVIDATCPFVKKAQNYAKLLSDEGYQVVIVGNKDHPEVIGILSYCKKDAVVVSKDDDLPQLKKRVGIVVQTTQPLSVFQSIVSKISAVASEMKIFNTICNSTAMRLKETEDLAKRCDLIIVVGGKNSANTTELMRFASSFSKPAYHIETASEIKHDWFDKPVIVGITAGASTPDWIIKDVCSHLRTIGGGLQNYAKSTKRSN